MQKARAMLAGMFLAMGGCAAASHPDLIREVEGLVRPGMPMDQAIAALESVHFRCKKSQLAGDDENTPLCSRGRVYQIISSCVQRVYVVPAADGTLARVDVQPPSCTAA